MAKQLSHEWVEAQKIVISTNLIAAAKKHLQFLEVVHKYENLFDGPLLEKAIFRYKYYWLPLLSEHTESSQLPKSPLVVPLDCEWIWHCHRLNPVRYMVDCIELFGKILDPGFVVVSSIDGACKKQTEEIWKKKYPQEAYELEFGFKNDNQTQPSNLQSTNYDLLSAVTRQSSFFHKVSGSIFKEDLYLEEAVKRYKGFLHLVSKNMEKKLDNPVVPTYDIDLMWHTHQLYPLSYCKDAINLVGQVLHHDDNVTDQSKGEMLDVGIKTTMQQWKEMFGSEYQRVLSRSSVHMMKREDSSAMTERCMCLPDQDGSSAKFAINYYTIKAEEDSSAMTTRCMMKARCMCLPEQDGSSAKSTRNYYTIKAEEDSFAMVARCMMTTRCMCLPEQDGSSEKSGRKYYTAKAEEALSAMTARCMCLPEQDGSSEKSGKKYYTSKAEEESSAMTERCMCLLEQDEASAESARNYYTAKAEEESSGMTARCMCLPEQDEASAKSARNYYTAKAEEESSRMTAIFRCLTEQMDGKKLIIESFATGVVEA